MLGRRTTLVWAISCGLYGCGGPELPASDDGSESENVGMATFALMTVPAGVGCVRIGVAGSSTVTRDFPLAANASTATLNMNRLPLGAVSVTGMAYTTTCGVGDPIYIADAASASLAAGLVTTISLTFRKNNPVAANVNFVGNVQAISAGYFATRAIIDGLVYGWGTGVNTASPTQISGFTNAVTLSTGATSANTCAVKTDGTLWCVGDNTGGQISPTNLNQHISTPVRYGTDFGFDRSGFGGSFHCAGLTALGGIKCSGTNAHGQLTSGLGAAGSTTPFTTLFSAQASLAVGESHVCVVDGGLTVRCVGRNDLGQLGDGTQINRSIWASPLSSALAVSAGSNHSCALLSDGSLKCWGHNSAGQLGDGTNLNRLTPVTVPGVAGITNVVGGGGHTCALISGGSVKCWGLNNAGQLGDGTLVYRSSATTVTGLPAPVVLLAAGYWHTCAVTDRQDIFCWGSNNSGELGNGSYVNAVRPVKVTLP